MSKHQSSRIVALAMMSLVISLIGIPFMATAGQRSWSVDLHDYGVMEGRGEDGRSHRLIVSLVATNNMVAVALGNPASLAAPNSPVSLYSGTWKVTLLLFDTNDGKLKKKIGPWSSDFSFELHPTAQGNFLLLLRHIWSEKENPGETLYLLSPSGEELKKMDLLPSIRRSKLDWSEFLVSSGGRTLLLGQIREDGVHYRALEADTLETKFEWTRETGSDSPWIVALSDRGLLGFRETKNQEKLRKADGDREAFVRSFDGPWHPLNTTLDVSHRGGVGQGLHPTQLAFLSDTVLVGVHAKRNETDGSIVALQSDGTILSRPVIPKLPDRTSLTGPVAVSAGGRYFAVGFRHQPWISHLLVDVMTMDITFWDDESLFLVWEASSPEPVARVPLGTDIRALSFASDDPPTLASISGSKLQVTRIQPKANAPKGQ
jgi:hypothetical protein